MINNNDVFLSEVCKLKAQDGKLITLNGIVLHTPEQVERHVVKALAEYLNSSKVK